MGLTHGMATGVRPELVVLPLRLPVKIFSGIAPPASLLSAMARRPVVSHLQHDATTQSGAIPGYDQLAPTPVSPTSPDQNFPARIGSSNHHINSDEPPPPSYEDAMAEEIGPLDGPRRDYNPPMDSPSSLAGTSDSFASDSKTGGLRRHISERLFPQNAPRNPDEPESVRESHLQTITTVPEDSYAPGWIGERVEIPPPKPPRRKDTKDAVREV